MPRLPSRRSPTHPGEMLAEEFMAPFGLTQVELATLIDVPFQRVHLIINAKRAVTPDTALRLAQLFGTTPEFWLNLQQAWDLYHAQHAPDAKRIGRIKRLARQRT
jgi:addiction module HigA family antidote